MCGSIAGGCHDGDAVVHAVGLAAPLVVRQALPAKSRWAGTRIWFMGKRFSCKPGQQTALHAALVAARADKPENEWTPTSWKHSAD